MFVESSKDVERQTQQFEGDKNYQDVLRSRQEHHANRSGQDEQDKLANMFRKSRVHRDQEREDRQDEQCNLNQMCKRIRYEHSVEDSCPAAGASSNLENCARTTNRRKPGSNGESDSESDTYARIKRSTANTINAVTATMISGNANCSIAHS